MSAWEMPAEVLEIQNSSGYGWVCALGGPVFLRWEPQICGLLSRLIQGEPI
jgi:hypothetical protein